MHSEFEPGCPFVWGSTGGGERTNSWLHHRKRLRVRDEPRDEVHFGFLVLSGCLIFFRNLKPSFC
ncbi:Isjp4 transposase [Stigmatella aurantiaca DW4/3-1]|uniref:Isjp4 transposase n=1 Tax=Stigmatella aurantiaca (strain DW4/3-1) TaxID=378806 RepID=E3FNR8_STIAD|nr:Isjp4 transposase [Stigmatella aurantiaca DW4/3-1]